MPCPALSPPPTAGVTLGGGEEVTDPPGLTPSWASPLPSSTQHPPRNQGTMALECLHAPFPQWHQAARGPGPLAAPTPRTGPGPNKDAVLKTPRLSKSVLFSFLESIYFYQGNLHYKQNAS